MPWAPLLLMILFATIPHILSWIYKRFASSLDDSSLRIIMLEWETEKNFMHICMFMIGYMLWLCGWGYIRAQRGDLQMELDHIGRIYSCTTAISNTQYEAWEEADSNLHHKCFQHLVTIHRAKIRDTKSNTIQTNYTTK